MSIGQHLAEHPVSIIVAFIGTLALTIIDPCIHNDFTFQVVAEKQPILLKEFGAEPVLMMAAQSMALPSGRIVVCSLSRLPSLRARRTVSGTVVW